MITASELRIGNWIKHVNANGSFYFQVIEILEKYINVKHNNGSWAIAFADNIIPIVLTPELLEKAGFKTNKQFADLWGVWQLPEMEFYALLETENGFELYINGEYDTGTYIKSLHHLQNLFFDLGKELEISL